MESTGEETSDESPAVGWQTDDPLTDYRDDRLGRTRFAASVAEAISGRQDPTSIVVGLFGPWGDGKSTILNFIEQVLGNDIAVVRFNPWLIGDESQLLPAFFQQVAAEIDVKLGGARRSVGEAFRNVGNALTALSVAAAGISVVPGTAAAKFGELLAGSSLDQRRKEFEAALKDADRRVVVMIDDLDRLDDGEIRAMFRLIRLAAPFDRVSYVVACDEAVIARALSAAHGGSEQTGHAYLEKIVQVPLHIPPASETTLARIALESLEDLLAAHQIPITDGEAREIGSRYQRGLAPALRTPRSVKRLLNALSFALPLLKGESRVADVVALEGIHVAFPRLYRGVREHGGWFIDPMPPLMLGRDNDAEYTFARQRVESLLPPDPAERAAALTITRALFPAVDAIWSNRPPDPDSAELFAQQRMGSPTYFERYLSYALPTDDISDQELDAVLRDAADVRSGIVRLVAAHGPESVGALTRKIDVRVERLGMTVVEALLDVLPELGPAVLDRSAVPSAIFGYSLQERLGLLIARLVLRMPSRQRLSHARRVVTSAKPLTFALECVRWFRARKDEGGERVFDEPTADGLQRIVGRRALGEFRPDAPPWVDEPRWPVLLVVAANGRDRPKVRRLVGSWLSRDDDAVDELLTGLAGRAVNLGTGKPLQQDFTPETYETLARVARVSDVRRAVRAKYGRVTVAEYPARASYVEDATRRVVEQFSYLDATAHDGRRKPTTSPSRRHPPTC